MSREEILALARRAGITAHTTVTSKRLTLAQKDHAAIVLSECEKALMSIAEGK